MKKEKAVGLLDREILKEIKSGSKENKTEKSEFIINENGWIIDEIETIMSRFTSEINNLKNDILDVSILTIIFN